MNDTKARLLQAACEAAGGTPALAALLGISEPMLRKYLCARFPMPDLLLLAAVDLIEQRRDEA